MHLIGCARMSADPARHYAGRDGTSLRLNRRGQRPVVGFDEADGQEIVGERRGEPVTAEIAGHATEQRAARKADGRSRRGRPSACQGAAAAWRNPAITPRNSASPRKRPMSG